MIQDIAPHRFYNEYSEQRPQDKDIVFIYEERTVFFKKDTKEYLLFEEYEKLLKELGLEPLAADIRDGFQYLFRIDEQKFFLARRVPAQLKEQLSGEGFEVFRNMEPMYMGFAGIVGGNISQWYENHTYCGRCAGRMQPDLAERALRCPDCGNLVYPVISPAVIVGVRNKNKLLLTKYARGQYKKYALVAGFTEIGESVEETVRREVMEEVGIKVKNITYYKSQPWPFSGTELMGFYADLDGEDTITLDETELQEGTWFEREELPPTEGKVSLTAEMIETFRAGNDKNYK